MPDMPIWEYALWWGLAALAMLLVLCLMVALVQAFTPPRSDGVKGGE